MKVFTCIKLYHGAIETVETFANMILAEVHFTACFPDCGGYKTFRKWFDYANGCTESELKELGLLESAHPGLKQLNPDNHEFYIYESELRT